MSHKNTEALERTIEALDGLGPEHDALVEHARTIADQLDLGEARGEYGDSKIHGEYRQVLKMMLEVGKKPELDTLAKILAEIAEESKK